MRFLVTFSAALLLFSCTPNENGSPSPDADASPSSDKSNLGAPDPSDNTWVNAAPLDTTPRVTGIGGVFFATADGKNLKEWYGKQLGLAIDPYGSPFEFRNANQPDEVNYLRWSPVTEGSNFFEPSEREFMINYRVIGIEALIARLEASGTPMLDSLQVVDYGKFIHFRDPDGNKVELWEPVDSVLTAYGGETTK